MEDCKNDEVDDSVDMEFDLDITCLFKKKKTLFTQNFGEMKFRGILVNREQITPKTY